MRQLLIMLIYILFITLFQLGNSCGFDYNHVYKLIVELCILSTTLVWWQLDSTHVEETLYITEELL